MIDFVAELSGRNTVGRPLAAVAAIAVAAAIAGRVAAAGLRRCLGWRRLESDGCVTLGGVGRSSGLIGVSRRRRRDRPAWSAHC